MNKRELTVLMERIKALRNGTAERQAFQEKILERLQQAENALNALERVTFPETGLQKLVKNFPKNLES